MKVGCGHLWANARVIFGARSLLGTILMCFALLLTAIPEAHALTAINVGPDQERIEITPLGELYEGRGDSLQIETAAGRDGLTGRMSVQAALAGTNPNWVVFALTNPSEKPIERWLAADRFSLIGSGIVWPDLDARRIEAVTPSIGFVPERLKSDRADIFRITLEPGQTITYVVELSSDRLARIYLWKPLEYEFKTSDRQLFNGVMLGLTGLMAIFLTAIFAANHKAIFPASALVAWCALGYLCVHFGFFHKLFNLRPEANAVYRAAAEAALAASLVVFLHVFLRLGLWHGLVRMLISVWLLAQFALIAVALIDPRLAATFARLSFAFLGATGAGLILLLAVRGQDRALSLVPTWILFLVWIFLAGVTLTGRLSGDIVVSSLIAGLVLILMLIGFTVTQFAFRSMEPMFGSAPSELQSRSMAVEAAGAVVWEWNARRDEVRVGQIVESWLGLQPGELSGRVDEFVRHLHPSDRERFRVALASVQERRDQRMAIDFRLRQVDNTFRWFELEAAGVPGMDPRAFRCVGLLRDVTDAKMARERLLHDAVRDGITGLPNRELLLDRLAVAMDRSKSEPIVRPTVISIDVEKFANANGNMGHALGDSLLLTVARRLQRHLGPNDTLARLGTDRFAILMLNEQVVADLAQYAERVRRSLRSPIKIAGQEMVLTGSLGIAIYDPADTGTMDLVQKSEIAMFRAKRAGADRIEVYAPEMRGDIDERRAHKAELERVLEKNQLKLFFQPIVYLPTEELAGFGVLVRWEHPTLGLIDPLSFVEVEEGSDLVVRLGAHALARVIAAVASWQKDHARPEHPLFAVINVSCPHLFSPEAIQELRHLLGRSGLPKGAIKLEVEEQVALDNPEQSAEILALLKAAGAEICLDSFGTGYSSFAYLDRLPFDAVKLDQALLKMSGGSSGAESTLLRSVVAMAREMGRDIIAGGVETPDEASFLRSIGCEFGFGPHCGAVIPEGEVAQVISIVRTTENRLKPRALFKTKPTRKASRATPARAEAALASVAGSADAGAKQGGRGAAGGRARVRVSAGALGGTDAGAPSAGRSNGGPGPMNRPMPPAPMGPNGNGPLPSPPPLPQSGGNGPRPMAPPMPPPMPPPQSPQMGAMNAHISRIAEVLPEVMNGGGQMAGQRPLVLPEVQMTTGSPMGAGPLAGGAQGSILHQLAAGLDQSGPPGVGSGAAGAWPPVAPINVGGSSPEARPGDSAWPAAPFSGQPDPARRDPMTGPTQPSHGGPQRHEPDFSSLPPSIAEGLARLAGQLPRKPPGPQGGSR